MSSIVPQSLPIDAAIIAALQAGLPDLRVAYRYGSAGGAYQRADSDIDLAVLTDRRLGFDELSRLRVELMRLTGRDVDLNDLRQLPVTLRVQIVADGCRLFAANIGAADEYAARTLADYARLNEERKGILEDVWRRGSIYG
ncbi:MAG: nucleotidyltransferase domain-containing protein [Betaproteobacteria bacterium]|nr:nucleotidyltransferase domain-containing protein [Betaproteobacteria bacterium]